MKVHTNYISSYTQECFTSTIFLTLPLPNFDIHNFLSMYDSQYYLLLTFCYKINDCLHKKCKIKNGCKQQLHGQMFITFPYFSQFLNSLWHVFKNINY